MAGIDEYTQLLIQSDTTDGSTTFTDSSGHGRSVTTVGSVDHTTDQAKFGSTSVDFIQASSGLSLDSGFLESGSDPWTVDFNIFLDSAISQYDDGVIFHNLDVSLQEGWAINLDAGWVGLITVTGGLPTTMYHESNLSSDIWVHVAVVFTGTDVLIFIGGTLSSTFPISNIPSSAVVTTLQLGQGSAVSDLSSYLDEIRYSSTARWTENFTPPTEAYTGTDSNCTYTPPLQDELDFVVGSESYTAPAQDALHFIICPEVAVNPRGMTSAVLAEIQKDSLRFCNLFEFEWTYQDTEDSDDFLTDFPLTLDWDSQTYLATGDVLSCPNISEKAQMIASSVTLELSGVNQSNLAKLLQVNFIGVPVSIKRAFLTSTKRSEVTSSCSGQDTDFIPTNNASGRSAISILPDPILIFKGRISSFSVAESLEGGTSIITINLTSQWVDFDSKAGRQTNNEQFQTYEPDDIFFEFSGTKTENFKWGRL